MGFILKTVGYLLYSVFVLPIMLLSMLVSMLVGLFFIGIEKVDEAAEGELGEPYSKARNFILKAIYNVFVALMVIGFAFFLLTMCTEGAGDADCDWSSRGYYCSPG